DSWISNYYTTAALHVRGQPEGQNRECNQDDKPDDVREDEGDYAFENGGETHVLHHAFYHEHVHPDRRMDEAELHRHHDDHAEPDRIESEMGDDREDDRNGEDDHR